MHLLKGFFSELNNLLNSHNFQGQPPRDTDIKQRGRGVQNINEDLLKGNVREGRR